MSCCIRWVEEKKILKLIWKYLKEGVTSSGGRHCKKCGFKFLHGADDTWRVGGDESNEESDNSWSEMSKCVSTNEM